MEKKLDIELDFSALEQRVAQYLGEKMPERTSSLLDIHTITAAVVNGVMYSSVTKPQRRAAKSINYSALYTPGSRWNPPAKEFLMPIWTADEQRQIIIDIGWTRGDLYEAIKTFFNVFNEARK